MVAYVAPQNGVAPDVLGTGLDRPHNPLVAAIDLWNMRCLRAAFDAPAARGAAIPPELVRHVAPLGWKHIGLTGDHVWTADAQPDPGLLRPLREKPSLLAAWIPVPFARAGHPEHFRVLTSPARSAELFSAVSPNSAETGGAGSKAFFLPKPEARFHAASVESRPAGLAPAHDHRP